MRINKNNCTQTVDGVITSLKDRGLDHPTMISVEYQVDGNSYVVSESIKLKSEKIKIGFLPIGQRSVPVMGETTIGSKANVSYNPNNPEEAFITHNEGIINI